jgi:hypothetical protein
MPVDEGPDRREREAFVEVALEEIAVHGLILRVGSDRKANARS